MKRSSHVGKVLAMASLVMLCGACARPWVFADPAAHSPSPQVWTDARPIDDPSAAAAETPQAYGHVPAPLGPSEVSLAESRWPVSQANYLQPVDSSPTAAAPADRSASPWSAPPFAADTVLPPPPCAANGTTVTDGPVFGPPEPEPPLVAPERPTLTLRLEHFASNVLCDYANYYSCTGLLELAGGVGVNAVLANTSLDIQFRNWYQDRVRTTSTDDFARFWKTFGEAGIVPPACAGLAVVGTLFDDHPLLAVVGDFGSRVTRGYLVGAPPMLTLQYVLGAGRPETSPSYWQPFQHDNGVSGHAFVGAVPFITAAKMVDNPLLKGGFYVLSTFPGWSRINDDQHYLSQVVLGWWMGYIAASAVDQTEMQNKRFQISPVCSPEMSGITFTWTN